MERRPLVLVDGYATALPSGDTITGAPVTSVNGMTGEVVLPSNTVTQLQIDGGSASTIFTSYLLRMDFGSGGANINPTGAT